MLYGYGFWRGLFTPLRSPGQRRRAGRAGDRPAVTGCVGHEESGLDQGHQACADPQRARHFFDLLAATSAGAAFKRLRPSRPASWRRCSAARRPEQPAGRPSRMAGGARPGGARVPAPQAGSAQRGEPVAEAVAGGVRLRRGADRLREFKQREMLRIAARDLARLGKLPEITAGDFRPGGCVPRHRLAGLPPATDRALRPAVPPGRRGRWQPTAGCVSAWANSAGRS